MTRFVVLVTSCSCLRTSYVCTDTRVSVWLMVTQWCSWWWWWWWWCRAIEFFFRNGSN